MRRREQSGDRPPIPDHFRRFDVDLWWDGPSPRDDNEAVEGGVDSYRRWCRARDAWAEENGYTTSEMFHATVNHVCRSCPP